MSKSTQKDTKSNVSTADAASVRSAARMPPGVGLPQMTPPPELVALQRKMQGQGTTDPSGAGGESGASTNSTGLPDGLKTGVEKLSGVSLDDVRVHYNSDKPADVGALAYTQGTEIHVAPGQEASVPHEAWHAAQQLQGRVVPDVQFKGGIPGNTDKRLEDEAERMGKRALEVGGAEIAPVQRLSQNTIARSVVQRDGDGDGVAPVPAPNPVVPPAPPVLPDPVVPAHADGANEQDVAAPPSNASAERWARAIATKYGVRIEARAWTRAELKSLYRTLDMVPIDHVKGAVRSFRRTPASLDAASFASWFHGDDLSIELTKRIPVALTMGAGDRLRRPFLQKFLMARSPYSQRMRSKGAFAMTTLHEVGHAVDNKLSIMDAFAAQPRFGGWVVLANPQEIFDKWVHRKYNNLNNVVDSANTTMWRIAVGFDNARHRKFLREHPVSDPRERAGRDKSMASNTAVKAKLRSSVTKDVDSHWERRIGIPKTIFDALGATISQGQSILSLVKQHVPITGDAAAQEMAKARIRNILEVISNLPPTKMVKHGRVGNNPWTVSRAHGQVLAADFNNKMYHESYSGKWVGYDIAAKDSGVSHYQFRAPGEFFAELYAHYYMGTLKGNGDQHPLYAFMEQTVGNHPDAHPQAMVQQGGVAPQGPVLMEGNVQVPAPVNNVDVADLAPPPLRPSAPSPDPDLAALSMAQQAGVAPLVALLMRGNVQAPAHDSNDDLAPLAPPPQRPSAPSPDPDLAARALAALGPPMPKDSE